LYLEVVVGMMILDSNNKIDKKERRFNLYISERNNEVIEYIRLLKERKPNHVSDILCDCILLAMSVENGKLGPLQPSKLN
jgi:hypothetical protein